MSETNSAERLSEIADQVRDGWIRCRGPLTGLKPLVAARAEAERLGADPAYLALLDSIVVAAREIGGASPRMSRRDAAAELERSVIALRAYCAEAAAA